MLRGELRPRSARQIQIVQKRGHANERRQIRIRPEAAGGISEAGYHRSSGLAAKDSSERLDLALFGCGFREFDVVQGQKVPAADNVVKIAK